LLKEQSKILRSEEKGEHVLRYVNTHPVSHFPPSIALLPGEKTVSGILIS